MSEVSQASQGHQTVSEDVAKCQSCLILLKSNIRSKSSDWDCGRDQTVPGSIVHTNMSTGFWGDTT